MRKNQLRWSGTDLPPLPYESRTSFLFRFSWRNALSAALIRQCSSRSTKFPFVFDSKKFAQCSSWHSTGADEAAFDKEGLDDRSVWRAFTFRYCPLCLEGGYHSFWFQLAPLEACPIHHVELTTRCHSCGAGLQPYLSKALFIRPYYCDECKRPICGVAPSLAGHLEFRELSAELRTAFQPYQRWWWTTQSLRQGVRWLHPWTGNQVERSTWCHDQEVMRSIICSDVSLPQYFSTPRYQHITVLTWQLDSVRDTPLFELFYLPFTWEDHKRVALPVYRATLRILERFIAEYEKPSAADITSHRSFEMTTRGNVRGIDVRGYRTRLFALCLMRWELEAGFGFGSFVDSDKAQFYYPRAVEKYSIFRPHPRLHWRAIYLAIYAAWYYRILSAKRTGWLEVETIVQAQKEQIFSHYEEERQWPDVVRMKGRVAFPSIQGLSSLLYSNRTRRGHWIWNSGAIYTRP